MPSASPRDRERRSWQKRDRRASEKTLPVQGSWNPLNLAQEGLRETAIHGDNMPRGLRTLITGKPNDSGRAILRKDGAFRQIALGIEERRVGKECRSRWAP